MTNILDHIFESLDIKRGKSQEDYFDHIDNLTDFGDCPIYSHDGKNYLSKALSDNRYNEILLLTPNIMPSSWKYSKIEYDNKILAEILFCPPEGVQSNTAPPTLGESLLLDGWLSGLYGSTNGFMGSVLAKVDTSKFQISYLSTLFRALNCSYNPHLPSPFSSFIDGKFQAQISFNGRFDKKHITYSKLIDRALRETDVRWRFFQLYRVLEQGYMEVILEEINSKFMHDPKAVLDDAKNSLTSEQNQLRNLVKKEGIGYLFEFIWGEINVLASSGNKFAIKVQTKASSYKFNEDLDKGCAAVYAIRCAIAHAGARDIYYEQYPDADLAVGTILSVFEETVLLFIGVKLVI